jgi:hypothetical protein
MKDERISRSATPQGQRPASIKGVSPGFASAFSSRYVIGPDGHETKGIEKHIEDLKVLFVFAPDLKIKVHPIRFGSGAWTAVTGVLAPENKPETIVITE